MTNHSQQIFIMQSQIKGLVSPFSVLSPALSQALSLEIEDADDIANTLGNAPRNAPKNTPRKNPPALLSMQAVVNAVLHPMLAKSQTDLAIINTQIIYRKWYKQVLSSLSSMHSSEQAAASSSVTENASFIRQGVGFTIKLVKDEKHIDDVYVIVNIDSINERQLERGVFLHIESDETFLVLLLQDPSKDPNNTKLQTIISRKSEHYKVLVNTDSYLYLT